jgi:uroporphyrinogen III methyltransferase/synthase
VGKADRLHILEQDSINQLLLEKAREGKMVVRLKGGDPFVLGRGGEEANALAKNGISFEVVPGISSAVAVPAYAGIPVTHRGVASSVTIITGHKAPEESEPKIAWDKISAATDTLVILMGLGNLAYVVDQLIKNGKSPSTPVAVITQGTTGRQRCLIGTLEDILAKVKTENLRPPSVIVIGNVVNLRNDLRWFDK